MMKAEGSAELSENSANELNDNKTKSNGLQEQDSTLDSFQVNNGSQENLDTPSKPTREFSPSEHNPSLVSSSYSSENPHHSSTLPPETNVIEETGQLVKGSHKNSAPLNKNSAMEWTFYPTSGNRTYHNGKKCIFDGIHLRNKTTSSEMTVEMRLGRKKFVDQIASRNGIPFVTSGDHPYACPEQSTNFHKTGAIRSPVNFGSDMYTKKPDTFIPLQRLPAVSCIPFRLKEKQLELEREKMEVKNLDYWSPAPTLQHSLFATGLTRRLTYQ
ncbi:spermatogenesis-associated serine-rich protein 1 isoform X2 [Sceloporus undulatus]|uniref:spermatogenesis-associated serine-rich protein 1 isoform X2 n=1 Tax=Sceloporus undulatus TaxID=8520 RepID=UPI001C4C98C2|nr:spermatogenesis-associated serine-rich protein 1 isoform X2 [Sceloporus undulatus]